MANPLTSRERAALKARAHALEPLVHVGGAGVTDPVVAEAERALSAHELIKVKIATDDREARVAMGNQMAERTGAAVVHRVGKVVILWRAVPDEEPSE